CTVQNDLSISNLHSMPQKGASKKSDRQCLICCADTRVAHLGIDVCRSCSVFYKRAEKGHSFKCRASTQRCAVGEGLNCKRCRFDHIDRLLRRTDIPSSSHFSGHDETSTRTPPEAPIASCSGSKATMPSSVDPSASSSANTVDVNIARTDLPLLNRLKTHYRLMCEARLMGELSARSTPPHPLEMNERDFIPIPATLSACNHANRIFLSALLHFGANAFPEFDQLSKEEKWTIITHFFSRFRLFEPGYRADKKFHEHLDRAFAGYTMYLDPEIARTFYTDPVANRSMLKYFEKDLRQNREQLRRLNMHHEEFLATMTLMFWDVGKLALNPDIMRTGDGYREIALSELQRFYRHSLHLDEYAPRMGELFTFSDICEELANEMKHNFELLRLLNEFTDETV
ncbi:hypothetical protein PFISCL1PPCAC_13127, partial [Pristionchus fissidentatus]